MTLSARNQLKGIVTNIEKGVVNGIVTLKSGDEVITGTISMSAIKDLSLEIGSEAVAIIKATEVMIGLGDLKLSARNQLRGKISKIEKGAVNSIISIDFADGNKMSSTISNGAVSELELEIGKEVLAVVKATSVMFGA